MTNREREDVELWDDIVYEFPLVFDGDNHILSIIFEFRIIIEFDEIIIILWDDSELNCYRDDNF